MSKTVDQRVVEMRFDNKQFEQGTRQTMSTLDKLKQKLNFSGASKGLEELNTSSINTRGSFKELEYNACQAGFSLRDVWLKTSQVFEYQVARRIVDTGKSMIKALTIDPVKTGFSEYETQINAVQTILANTSSKGTTIDQVNEALEELNTYADKTIYNFTEMTRNIGTFTAAGVDLETSVGAIQGIANLAAVSGSTSQQASTAMYQLSQALSAGTVKLQDWNSVVNAGMGGEMFQNALKETSEALGTGAKAAIKAEGSFRESMKTGWLTAEVLTETLKKFTSSGANEYVAKYTGLSVDAVKAALDTAEATYGEADAIKEASKALAEKSGKNAKEIADMLNFAKNAEDAATKVKTFTQLWDVLKESAQSGWSQTWKIIVGDFEEAKKFLTPLADFLTGIIGKFSKARNDLLESALGQRFKDFGKVLTHIGTPLDKAVSAIDKVNSALKDMDTMVNEVIRGNWGNGETRYEKLTEAGYNYYAIQNKVNETLGASFRYSEKLAGAQTELNKAQEDSNETQKTSIKDKIKYLEQLSEMSDAELKNLELQDDQIKALRQLREEAKMTGLSFEEFVTLADTGELTGRWLILNSFKNIGSSLVSIFKSIGTAWRDAFPAMSSNTLYKIIAGFHKFSMTIKDSVTKNAEKLTRTLKGLFAVIDLITMVVGGGFKIALAVVKAILKAFDTDILSVTAHIGDAIVKFRNWIEQNSILTDVITYVAEGIKTIVDAIRNWVKNNEVIQRSIKNLKDSLFGLGDGFKAWIEGLKETDNVPKYIVEGLAKGIWNGIKFIAQVAIELGKCILEAIKGVLRIESPSKEMEEVGEYIIEGLINGLELGLTLLVKFIKKLGEKIVQLFNEIDLGAVISIAFKTGLLILIKDFLSILNEFSKPLNHINDILKETGTMIKKVGNMFDRFGKGFEDIGKGFKRQSTGKAIKDIAIAIGILAVSVYLLTKTDQDRLWSAVGALAALSAIVVLLGVAVNALASKKAKGFTRTATSLIIIAAALALLTGTMKKLATIKPDEMVIIVEGLVAMMVTLGTLLWMTSKMNVSAKSVLKLIPLVLVLSMMASVIKKLAKLDPQSAISSAISLSILLLAVSGVMAILSKMTLNIKDIGLGVLALTAMAIPLLAFVGVLALMKNIDNATENVIALTILATALSLLLIPLSLVGILITATSGLALLGVVGLLAMAVPMLAFVGVLALMKNVENATENAKLLTNLMIVMSDILIKISIIAPLAMMGVTAMGALTLLIGAIGTFAVAIGALMVRFPVLEKFLDSGLSIMIRIADGMGQMVGAFIKGALTQISNSLPAIGMNLSLFMINLTPFIVGAKMIDDKVVSGIKSLAESILLITASNLLESLTSWITGKSSIAQFGSQLGLLGLGLRGFVNSLGTFNESQIGTINAACNALRAIAQVADAIPNEGGLWSLVAGDNKLTNFAAQMPKLGEGLSGFISKLGAFDASRIPAIDASCQALKSISDAAKTIPNEGGLWGLIAGDNKLNNFAEQMPKLGEGLSGFITKLGTFDADKIPLIDTACQALKSISDAAKTIPNEGGLWGLITGENRLKDFAEQIPYLGDGLSGFISKIGSFDASKIPVIEAACKSISALAELGKIDMKSANKNMKEFSDGLINFAKNIKTFITDIGKLSGEKINSAIDTVNKLVTMAQSAADANNSSLKTFGDSLIKIAKDGVKGFIEEFNKKSTISDAEKAGTKLADATLDKIKDKKDSFKSAGKDLVQGLINGLKDSKKRAEVEKAAKSLGQLAVKAEKEGQESNSPSKATEQAGRWLGEGLVIGIQKMGSRVYGAGKSMGETATNSISNALNTAMDLLNSDMDSQPTIRPVLDLSDVESGAGYLNSMFNSQSIGVNSNLRAISLGMSSTNQNGANNDIVTAINKLRKDLGNVGSTTYNVNGVTYDDGSNITEAVRTIVRAAKVERRI